MSHLRALALVAVAAAAEHADQLARRRGSGPQREQRFFERVGRVRVIDDDQRLAVAAATLHASRRRRQRRQRSKRSIERDTAFQQNREDAQQISGIEFADDARLHGAAAPGRCD